MNKPVNPTNQWTRDNNTQRLISTSISLPTATQLLTVPEEQISSNLQQSLETSVSGAGEEPDGASGGYSSAEESEDELEMAAGALMPKNFHGKSAEDAEAWWIDVENYSLYRKLTNDERVGLIPLLLKD